ncbi:DoxX family protein [Salmonella enterica subsp. enterica serovar Reading]|nr:DoxX family protein [Salmonella enterica subsp. enterica serovar Reading]
MILSSDNNDALNRAIAHENSNSSRIGLLENKMKKLEDVGVLIARILMPVLFITAGWGKISGYAGTQQYMEAMGVPGFLLPLTILLEFGGGLAILLGFLTRTTALFTAGFTLLTALIFHSNFAEGVNSLMFMKNLTIAGGFLLLALTGPGAFSLDRLLNKKW